MNATFDWIARTLRDDIDFVIWTGDSARHDSDEKIPRNQDQVLSSNRYVASKFIDLFADETASTGLSVPVVPTFGNNDILPHNILLPGPNKWLRVYADIWRRFIPEEQRHSFEFGGWFYVEVIPSRLAVFSLNTLYFFDRNAGVDDCATPSEPGYKQFEWLRVQLQFMRERGMKAILMGHVPPARTNSKQLWDETCWQKYTLWLKQYRDVIVSGLFGHMNIDHFLLQDDKEIDLSLLQESPDTQVSTREEMEDELSVESASDYLHELRKHWSTLEPPPTLGGNPGGVDQDKKKDKKKKGSKGGNNKKKNRKYPWGERYSLSLVGPSVVPNYFPTLRVFEYNITGLENAGLWRDSPEPQVADITTAHQDDAQKHLDLRGAPAVMDLEWTMDSTANRKKKNPKKDKKKPGKPKDRKLVVPDPPSTSSPPGPAYSAQPLTLMGYTQYFANLTFINNLTFVDDLSVSALSPSPPQTEERGGFSILESLAGWLSRWRRGKQGDKKPKNPHQQPQPREFHYQVEYSTFDDKIYKLDDLTVNSFVELAYRIGQKTKKSSLKSSDLVEASGLEGYADDDGDDDEVQFYDSDDIDEDDTDDENENDESDNEDDELEAAEKVHKDDKKPRKGKGGKKKNGHKKKKKKAKKINKTWLHFLDHAFVGTVDNKDLKKYASQ